jgi:hypothetical protein
MPVYRVTKTEKIECLHRTKKSIDHGEPSTIDKNLPYLRIHYVDWVIEVLGGF